MSHTIQLNGQPVHTDTGATITDLLREKGIEPTHVVVEINRNIIERAAFDTTVITTGDTVEILRFVGGG